MHKLNPTIALALFVATIPSLWAVVAPFVGVTVGAAALITGGFFVASGNDPKNKWRELFGMWLGIPWGMMAVTFPGLTGWPKTTLFVTLFVLGALAVLISGMLQTAKPDQSTEAAARRGRKEKFHNVYATEKIPLGVFPVSIFDTGNT